jgi:hypothetical protein
LLLTLPVWVLAAALFWAQLAVAEPLEDVPLVVWRAVLLAWVFGLGLAVIAALLSYVGMGQASRAEARLFLQDQAWRETRKDQARLNGWLVWGRLRRQRKEEA